MKHLINIALFLLVMKTSYPQQQLINGNFEDTYIVEHQLYNDTLPLHFTTSPFGAGTTTDAYSGQRAAFIWNWYYYAKGEITNGNAESPLTGGMPVTYKPVSLNGYYKYIYGDYDGNIDSAVAIICLTKYNTITSVRDTIGYTFKKLEAIDNYTPFSINVEYFNNEMPDTVTIKFISSENGSCNFAGMGNCFYLYLDDITISDITGTKQAIDLQDKIKLYPNPFDDVLHIDMENNPVANFTGIKIFDATGKVVFQKESGGNQKHFIDTKHLAAGAYLLKVGNNIQHIIKK